MLKRVLAYDQKVQNERNVNLYRSELESWSSTLSTEHRNGPEEMSKNSSEQIELSNSTKIYQHLIDYRATFVVTACGLYVWPKKSTIYMILAYPASNETIGTFEMYHLRLTYKNRPAGPRPNYRKSGSSYRRKNSEKTVTSTMFGSES